jgi:hypothetical protein
LEFYHPKNQKKKIRPTGGEEKKKREKKKPDPRPPLFVKVNRFEADLWW